MNHDITCVGLTILDILGKGIEEIPDPGKTALIEKIRITPAGTAAGPAVIAAKPGLKTALVATGLGSDAGVENFEQIQKALNTLSPSL